MELKQLIKLITQDKKSLLFATGLGIILGIIAFILPSGFNASGSIYVGRITDRNLSFFTYEGYYGQQTALAYTNSVLGLLQSTDLLNETLLNLEIPSNDYEIWKLKRSIDVKKSGPQTQVINLTVKGKSKEDAEHRWNVIYKNIENYTNKVSVQSDPSLKVYKVSENPIIRQGYKSLPIFIMAGIGLSLAAMLSKIIFSEYLKEGENVQTYN